MSKQFAQFLRKHNIVAATTFATSMEHPDSLGYMDRRIKGDDCHAVVFCRGQKHIYMIDWSPSQYGYTDEWPLIRQATLDGTWIKPTL